MMRDFSMHILDIVQNSIRGEATDITIEIIENTKDNIFSLAVKDNGCGMSEEMLMAIRNPFTTSRSTRKVGLGIPFLEQTCQQCGGYLELESKEGQGTYIKATMEHNHIDRPPLGPLASTIYILIVSNPAIDFNYIHKYNDKEYILI